MKPANIPFALCRVLLITLCCVLTFCTIWTWSPPDEVDTDAERPDSLDVLPGLVPNAPNCVAYCQGLMDKPFAPGGNPAVDLACLRLIQDEIEHPPAFDLACLAGALSPGSHEHPVTPTYEDCIACYTGEETGDDTCADLVGACLIF